MEFQVTPGPQKTLREYGMPSYHNVSSSILAPEIEDDSFEFDYDVLLMLMENPFQGDIVREDPYSHLDNFLKICDTFKVNGVSDDAIRLRLFPFSLAKGAKDWLRSQRARKFTTWKQLSSAFLTRYFPPAKTALFRNAITGFVQEDGESLYGAWERYNELLRKCPHHEIPLWLLMQTFYNGLSNSIRMIIDAAAGGSFMGRSPEEAFTLMDEMASSNYEWTYDGQRERSVSGSNRVDEISMMSARIDALTKDLENLKCNASAVSQPPLSYDVCGASQLPMSFPLMEQQLQEVVGAVKRLEVQVGQPAIEASLRPSQMEPRYEIFETQDHDIVDDVNDSEFSEVLILC